MRMQDKVAIITGGAGGLGGATARWLAAEGAHVVITDIGSEAGEALAADIGGRFIRHDVTDESAWLRLIDDTMQHRGKVDVLVNAAGIEGDLAHSGLATSLAEWRRVMAINLDGTFLGCRAVMPAMLEAGSGSIVNISSIVCYMGTPSGLAYGASKAGVEQLTRSIAMIGAQDGKRVRCNSVHPGIIRTRMTDNIIAQFAQAHNSSADETEAAMNSAVPFGERGQPDDIAKMVLFLASDESRYVTGSAFKVDGGWSVSNAG